MSAVIRKAIQGLNSQDISMCWKEARVYVYRLNPRQRLRLEKKKNRVLLDIPGNDFDKNVPILRLPQYHPISIEDVEISNEGIVIELNDGEFLKDGEQVNYKGNIIKWERRSSSFSGKVAVLEDEKGNRYEVDLWIDRKDYHEVQMKKRVPVGTKIKLGGQVHNYTEITPPPTQEMRLMDSKGLLDFFVEKDGRTITLDRKISGLLRIENSLVIDYQELDRKPMRGGDVEIIIFQDESKAPTADDDMQDQAELFLDILSASMDFELWETPRDPLPGKRIKVKRIKREQRILTVERLPSSEVVFPPNISYQLEMQKRAIDTLVESPSPHHRPLLRLFESHQQARWPGLDSHFSKENVSFEFLTTGKESTPIQQDFVIKALNTPDFTLLEGPPGSGKTTAITELIVQVIKTNRRVMLSSSTHVAVDNVLEKLLERFGSPENLMNNGIVPLRIGREERVSRDIKAFQIDNRKEVMKQHLADQGYTNSANQDALLEELVCATSNLVCGTSIGVLQYPMLKRNRKGRTLIHPEFDYLIVDEASKTTFHEFLVPALFSQKWIIVGDVRQLAPYTDILYAQVNFESLRITQEERKALQVLMKLHFEVNKTYRKPKFIYQDEYPVIQALHQIISEKKEWEIKRNPDKRRVSDLKCVFLTRHPFTNDNNEHNIITRTFRDLENDFSILVDLFAADIIFISDIEPSQLKYLPATHLIFSPGDRESKFLFRHYAWCKRNNWNSYEYPLPKGKRISDVDAIYDEIAGALKKPWSAEIAWRLKRMYELQSVRKEGKKDPTKYYEASLWALLPAESNWTWNDIKKVAQALFPSILSSLQEGVSQYFRSEQDRTVLSNGFPRAVLDPRHVLLKYQNRMHPEISALPRDLFYNRVGALVDTKDIVNGKDREWNFPLFSGHRLVWINVNNARVKRNQNQKEADEVFKLLDMIIAWNKKANEHGKENPLTIALLTFYEAQRVLFKDMMRKKYPTDDNKRGNTQFRVKPVKIFCYTVDKVQGREADIVILSMVQNARVGFMDCPNRLNVAITRAKYLQVVVGDRDFFRSDSNKSWELTEMASKVYCVNDNR